MSLDKIRIDSTELIEKKPLDAGGFGMVSLCFSKNHGLVVLKTVYTGPQRTEFNSSLLEEGKMMHRLNHDRVIKLIGVILEEGNYSLVMEFMENGNLLQLLKCVSVPLSVKGRITLEIIEGMAYLNEQQIVHKDLKPENILVDADYHIKIADLGVATFKTWSRLTEEQNRRSNLGIQPKNNAGTLCYLAPEHLQSLNTKPTEKSDVYSFSIVVWVIMTNKEPYENAVNDTQIYHLVLNGDRPDVNELPNEAPEEIVNLMQQCWENKPESRPTFKECNHKLRPFYEEKLSEDITTDIETLRELTRVKPTAPRELVKRMQSLQMDSNAELPSHATKDDPNSLHSSQGNAASGHIAEDSFAPAKLNEPSEEEYNSQALPPLLRKLDDEYNYHMYGSRLDNVCSQYPESQFNQIMEERSRRVSNEPVFTNQFSAKMFHTNPLAGLHSAPMSSSTQNLGAHPDLYQGAATYDSLCKPAKEETSAYATKTSPVGIPMTQGEIAQRGLGTIPISETGSLHVERQLRTPLWQEHTRPGNVAWNTANTIGSDSNLNFVDPESTSRIFVSNTKTVQIGSNNVLNIEKQVFNKKKKKNSAVPNAPQRAEHLEIFNDRSPVKDSHLDLLRSELGKDWKHCARKLGFRESEIDEIDHDYERDGLKEKVYQMLHKWQMKEGGKGATVNKLAQALQSCKRFDLTLSLQNCA
uniref:Receptor (TNFRSF)-interacting serine-threonine kinase 1, like n=1 Tax=Callorhinchus milii TaxID=7868 RepID=A0A4W3K8B3_CALMI|eukprot:gi/632944987/ref/XP_007887808.1/ PREDICTED: receptor-interacting serine/threonine-protein kinase 1 isoform X1 [Callorhinchus milii]